MRQLKLITLLTFLIGAFETNAYASVVGVPDTRFEASEEPSDVANGVVLETSSGERMEYLLSTKPQFRQDKDKVTLTYNEAGDYTKTISIEFSTEDILKVYLAKIDLPNSIEGVFVNDKNEISVEAGLIRLSGFKPGEIVRVYSLDGKLQSETTIPENGELTISIATLPKGVNVININKKSIKITRQ